MRRRISLVTSPGVARPSMTAAEGGATGGGSGIGIERGGSGPVEEDVGAEAP